MKKQDVISLIRYHIENNDNAFRDEAYMIAEDFCSRGDKQIGLYIYSLLSDHNTFIPQDIDRSSEYLRKIETPNNPLPLPAAIYNDIIGIVNAAEHDSGINKFLFSGAPGTGKTESAKQLARIMGRELYLVETDSLIDSRLGQTSKNIAVLFNEINGLYAPERVVILFDEIDSIALDRTDSHDLREMGRATSAFLRGFDSLIPSAVVVATTNLIDHFDKALLRRFDRIVDFNRYSQDDLLQIADSILDGLLKKFTYAERNMRLFHKILALGLPLPYPADLRNMIRGAIAFSNPDDGTDYFRQLLIQIRPDLDGAVKELGKLGFTTREIEKLSSISKSSVSRLLREEEQP